MTIKSIKEYTDTDLNKGRVSDEGDSVEFLLPFCGSVGGEAGVHNFVRIYAWEYWEQEEGMDFLADCLGLSAEHPLVDWADTALYHMGCRKSN